MYVYGNLINFQWHPSILYIFQTVSDQKGLSWILVEMSLIQGLKMY